MTTVATALDGRALPASHGSRRRTRYFLVVSALALGLVLAGFAKSYFLRGLLGAAALPQLLHVHGAAMTCWVALALGQSVLVATRRVAWHRRIGWAGVGSAVLVVILGTVVTYGAAAREVALHSAEADARLTVLGLELTQMLQFASLFACAIAMRSRPEYHKRLMLLVTACLLPSPLVRLPLGVSTNLGVLMTFDGLVLSMIVADVIRVRRLHPAFGYGGLWLLGGLQLTYAGAYTPAWHQFATWLVS